MVNLNAEPPQGRDDSQQLRTTGRFSIPFIPSAQGVDANIPPPTVDTNWVNGANNMINGANNLIFAMVV